MPHSIFFRGGYAIHGTYEVAHLGRPVSHGCVRLSPANAATLYALVKAEGATITISGAPPSSSHVAAAPSPRHRHVAAAAPHRAPPLAYAPAPRASSPVYDWLHNPVGY